jgi:hypothetical protein
MVGVVGWWGVIPHPSVCEPPLLGGYPPVVGVDTYHPIQPFAIEIESQYQFAIFGTVFARSKPRAKKSQKKFFSLNFAYCNADITL